MDEKRDYLQFYPTEIKIMRVLWNNGDMKAAQICKILQEETGWNQNTTYTIIKRCMAKGYVERQNPGFWCHPIVGWHQAVEYEIRNLINRFFDGKEKEFVNFITHFVEILNKD